MLTDLAFIVGLHRTESDKLGFIPAPTIRDRYLAQGNYVIVRDRQGRSRGYILHGPTRPGRPLHITQVCTELDHRLRGFAANAVRTIELRGLAAGCTELRLRCALELPANAFWRALGFQLRGYAIGGNTSQRIIAEYILPLGPADARTLVFSFSGPTPR